MSLEALKVYYIIAVPAPSLYSVYRYYYIYSAHEVVCTNSIPLPRQSFVNNNMQTGIYRGGAQYCESSQAGMSSLEVKCLRSEEQEGEELHVQ